MRPFSPRSRTDWNGLRRGRIGNPFEWLAEKVIFLVSLLTILMVLLMFVFLGREALPVVIGRVDTSESVRKVEPAEEQKMSGDEARAYLGLSQRQYESMDEETLRTLLALKQERARELASKRDAQVNTVKWRYLLPAYQWEGYSKPEFIWQPVSDVPKYNIVPLLVGSAKVALVALFFAVPLAVTAAIYVSQLAPRKVRESVKPAIEILAGIPSVVLGFFALLFLATALQRLLGQDSRLNALCAGLALGVSVIPLVFSLTEEAFSSVPRSYVYAALALGASRWKAAWQVVVPAAAPGIFAAVALGVGRALGETMIVLMASGNASILSWSPLDSTRTIAATIAAELGEVVYGSPHYRMLFLIGAILFLVTFITNLCAQNILARLRARLEGNK
jgi:phosphate transport system permease protein